MVTSSHEVEKVLKMVGQPGPTMLPVVDNDRLVGVVTKADLLFLVNSPQPIEAIMTKKMHTVSPDDRIVHARRIMIDENVARLPVVDQGTLLGIISDIEIAFAFASLKKSFSIGRQKHKLDELLVKDVMKSPVMWTTRTVRIVDAAKLMMKHNIGSLPVIDNNTLVGIITRTDLLRTIKFE